LGIYLGSKDIEVQEVQDEFTASIHYPYDKYYFFIIFPILFLGDFKGKICIMWSVDIIQTAQLPVSKKQRTAHNSSGNSVSCGGTHTPYDYKTIAPAACSKECFI
jgi:hypothetical protein